MSICANPNPPFGTIDAGCASIDASNYDDGFLDIARTQNPGVLRHDQTSVAVDNLINCIGAAPKPAHLIGHGIDGRISTGIGQMDGNDAFDPTKYIGVDNQPIWNADLARLGAYITSLTLWSCNTGSDDAGAQLVAMVAKALGKPVAAFSGKIDCQGPANFQQEADGCWQVGDPNGLKPPKSILPPNAFGLQLMAGQLGDALGLAQNVAAEDVAVPKNAGNHIIQPAAVESVEFSPLFVPKGSRPFSTSGSDSADLLSKIQFAAPLLPAGPFAAMANGYLVLNLSANGTPAQSRKFTIYNYRLLKDNSAEDTYYNCAPDFQDLLLWLARNTP